MVAVDSMKNEHHENFEKAAHAGLLRATGRCAVPLSYVQRREFRAPSLPSHSRGFVQKRSFATGPQRSLIYAVDGVFWLTQLYARVLEAAGYGVKVFGNRSEALAALKAVETKPDLLITDDLGHAMPV